MNGSERDARVDDEVAGPLQAARPALDELHRARLVSAIDAALDREDRARAKRSEAKQETKGRRFRIVAVGAVAAALALWIGFRPDGGRAPAPLPPLGGGTAAVAPPAAGAAAAEPAATGTSALLRPYHEPGHAPAALAPATSLVALHGERARATIGTRVRLTLVGEGRVSVLAAAREGDIELALDGGRLLVEYDGDGSGTLRVRSPGALTTVVGTLFAVDVMGSGSRVAVAHGRVRTEDLSGGGAQVGAGSSWTSADGRPAPIPADVATALVEHQTGWARPPGEPDAGGGLDEPRRPPRSAASRPAPRSDLEALYAKAEAAMRERSLGEARRALEAIAVRDHRGPLGEAALLDLARLALADGDRAEARRTLARLQNPPRDPALAETAAHLRCRARQPGAAAAADCAAR
jgi:hypothetical protein